MRRRILSLILSLAMLFSFVPDFTFAQEVQDQGEKFTNEVIAGEDGKTYTAFHLDGYTVKDILGYGPRLRAAGDEIPSHTLDLSWIGRTYEEFPFPEEGIELRLAPKSDINKIIATITYTKDDIYLETEEDAQGNPIHLRGWAKKPKNFKETKDFTKELLDEGVDMLIPYGISFHPELFATQGGTQTFTLKLEQKANPLWTAEWNVSDKYAEESKKPEIKAFYKDNGSSAVNSFNLPKNDNIYSMQSVNPQRMYWDGEKTINIWEETNENLHKVFTSTEAEGDIGVDDYTGKLSDDALLLVSDAADPRPFIGFGTNRKPNDTGFYQKDANSPKFLLNTYPSPDKINTPNAKVKIPASAGKYLEGKEIPAYRALKRYAVYEAVNVKFNTGEGFLNDADKTAGTKEQNINVNLDDAQIKAQTIENADYADKGAKTVKAQTMGYGEKLADNESERQVVLPTTDPVAPTLAKNSDEYEFKGWKFVEADRADALKNPQKLIKDANGKETLTEVSEQEEQGKIKVDFKTADEAKAAQIKFTKSFNTFYAIYGPKAQGKVNIKYVDENGKEIISNKPNAKDYRFISNKTGEDEVKDGETTRKLTLDEKYPADKKDDIGKTIDAALASTAAAPTFIGYKVNGVEVTPAAEAGKTQTFTEDGKYTITYKYKKLDDIIPAKNDDGTENPKVTDDVKATYIPVTWKVDNVKGKFTKETGNPPTAADVEGTEFTYYVNPIEKKTFSDVIEKSGLKAASKDENKYRLDTENPCTFNPNKVKASEDEQEPSVVVDNGTEINKLHFTVEKGLVVTVNFEETAADKLKDKLEPQDIRVWVDDPIDWSKGVKLNDANKDDETLKGLLAGATVTDLGENGTLTQEGTKRNSSEQNLPEGKKGNLKVAFGDGSVLVVENQTLYVSPTKVKVEQGTDETKLPDDKIKVELKLGEGVKVGDTKGNKANPVIHSTFYIKPNTGLAEADFPTLDVQSDYKTGTGKWDKNKTTVFPGRLKSDNKTYEDESFLASATKLGDGTVNVEYYADETKIDDISAYKLSGKTYITSKQGTEDTEVKVADLTNDYHDLIGYEKDTTKGTDGIEVEANTKYLTSNPGTVKFYYKKIDDIVAPKPGDTKPAGYLTVTFKANSGATEQGKLWLKTDAQAEAPTDESKLFTELVYYVNPINATLDLDANILTGKKANGQEVINVEVYAKVTDGKSKVKLNDTNKYVWDKNPADAIGTDKKVKKDVTLTVQYDGLKIAEIIKKENLAPVTLKVWVGDTIPWKNGVKVADRVTDETWKATIEGYLNDAKTSYADNTTPARTSNEEAVNNPKTGIIRVTFSDKSYIDVEKQDLYVIPHVTSSTNNNTPDGAIEVTFKLGEGVQAGDKTGAETPVEYGKYKVKPNTNLDTYKLSTGTTIFGNINAEVTDTTKYTGVVWEGQTANKPEDHVVTSENNVFTAKASKIFTVKHVFKGIDADKQGTPDIAANELPEELKAGANTLIPVDKKVNENDSYTPSDITTKVTQTIKDNQGEVTAVYEWTFKEWLNKEELKNISEDKTVTGIWERRQAKSENPTVNPVKPGDKEITGGGKPVSDIIVELPDGSIVPEKVKPDGTWEVKIPEGKEPKDKDVIKVTQTEKGKKPSDPVTVIVGEEPQPAPQPMPTPDYNPWWPIYFGSTKTEAKKEEPKPLERHEAYIAGYPDGTVRPDGKITRAEVSAIFARLTESSAPANYSPKFSDVLAYDWFCDSVMKLSNKDIIKGYPDGTFKPNKSITRAEFAVIASKYIKNPKAADETFSDVPMNHWAKDAIAMVKAEGWISGYTDGTFKPDAPITRAEAVSIVNRMFDRAADGEFVREHGFEITKFGDLNSNHWAYYEMIEATHSHDYERIDKRTERWEKIVK